MCALHVGFFEFYGILEKSVPNLSQYVVITSQFPCMTEAQPEGFSASQFPLLCRVVSLILLMSVFTLQF